MSGFVTVTVRQGALKGRRQQTTAGTAFHRFLGIPYAKPPLGVLRFKSPEPADSWTGIRDATNFGNPGAQWDPLSQLTVGDEDCLFLNVYSPRLPNGSKRDVLLPVLVWIHGGGFMVGSSNMFDAAPLMDYGVVIVTINYRIGPFGFLGLGIPEAPGNAGLKDQTMALRWVKENISVFGGDSANVTIFGESAGGASVHYHVLSPLSKGLFRRGIAQSGSALNGWAFCREPVARAKRLALAAGCDPAVVEDPGALLKWLHEVPAPVLLGAVNKAKTPDEWRRGLVFTFVPCVEPAQPGAFLARDPAALIASGDVNRVPLIMGITSHEGMLMLPGCMLRLHLAPPPKGMGQLTGEEAAAAMEEAEAKMLSEIASDLERLLPEDLLAGKRDMRRSRQLVERVKEYFFDGNQLSEDTLNGYVDINTDVLFGIGVIRAARQHAHLGVPVYLYEFGFQGRNNFVTCILGDKCKVKGAAHGDELAYQFNFVMVPKLEAGGPEEMVRKRLNRMWTDFAKSGNPTPTVDELITTTWLPYTDSSPAYIKISEELRTDTALLHERVQFWEDLYKK